MINSCGLFVCLFRAESILETKGDEAHKDQYHDECGNDLDPHLPPLFLSTALTHDHRERDCVTKRHAKNAQHEISAELHSRLPRVYGF